MDPNSVKSKGFLAAYKIPLIVVLAILVILAVVLVANRDNTKPTTDTPSSATAGDVAGKAGSTLVIKDLGVQIILPSSLAGMTYTTATPSSKSGQATPIVNLSLNQYTDLANKCLSAANSVTHTFASLIKIPGKAGAGAQPLKQFNDFYIAKLTASLPKDTKCKDAATQQSFDSMTKTLNDALQSSFQDAKQI